MYYRVIQDVLYLLACNTDSKRNTISLCASRDSLLLRSSIFQKKTSRLSRLKIESLLSFPPFCCQYPTSINKIQKIFLLHSLLIHTLSTLDQFDITSYLYYWNHLKKMLLCQFQACSKVNHLRECVFPTLHNPMDCGLAHSCNHGIFQARILEWVAISYSWGSCQLRHQTHISCVPCTGMQNQLYLYIHPLFFLFFSQIGHYRVLSIVPWALQQVLISYLFYIQQGVYHLNLWNNLNLNLNVNLNLWNNLLIHLPASILEIHQYPSSQQAFEDEERVTILHKVFVISHCS